MEESKVVPPTEKFAEMLEKGLSVMQKVLEQEVKVNRQEMIDLLNFETVVKLVIDGQKQMAGKSFEEIMNMRKDLEQKVKEQDIAA